MSVSEAAELAVPSLPTPQSRRRGNLVAVAIIVVGLAVMVLSLAATHVATCHGYMEIPPKHVMSDLYGGAETQWLPICR